MVSISVEKSKIANKQTSLLVLGLFEDGKGFSFENELDREIVKIIKEIIDSGEFTAKIGSTVTIPTFGKAVMKRIMITGLGTREKFSTEIARIVAGKIIQKCRDMNISECSIVPFVESNDKILEAITEGICLASYAFKKFKTESDDKDGKLKQVKFIVNDDSSKLQSAIERAQLISEAVNFARELGNMPPNECTPATLADAAQAMSSSYDLKVRIIERYELESLGMGGIVAVGKGSSNPPKLIIVEYQGVDSSSLSSQSASTVSKIQAQPYLLVGKAVTFDTGGISLKPGDRMDEMKFDKCGGCTVLATIKAIASLKLPVNVVAIIPAVENMPSSSSYRPGDIITMFNKKTVEVLNTDAEGRMILADALAFGISNYSPRCAIDLATLTGACIIALGSNVAGMLSNNEQLADLIREAGDVTGEKLWQLPLYEEYFEQIKSHVADMKNIGGRPGGTITASAFLSKFVNDIPWIHLDIAGTAWTQDGTFEKSYIPKGATGFGVRTLVKFLSEYPAATFKDFTSHTDKLENHTEKKKPQNMTTNNFKNSR